MNCVLLSPHNDDESLFASVIMQRMKPKLVVVTDSYVQFNRGQKEITWERRRYESKEAARLYGVDIEFLGIRDDELPHPVLVERLQEAIREDALVFAPAHQGGHVHHDIISDLAVELFDRVVFYATYAYKQNFTPYGIPLNMSPEEREVKKRALACYESQHWQGHFKGVEGKDEYIS